MVNVVLKLGSELHGFGACFFGIFAAATVVIGLGEEREGVARLGKSRSGDFQVHDRCLEVTIFYETRSHLEMRPRRIRLKFDRFAQRLDGL